MWVDEIQMFLSKAHSQMEVITSLRIIDFELSILESAPTVAVLLDLTNMWEEGMWQRDFNPKYTALRSNMLMLIHFLRSE